MRHIEAPNLYIAQHASLFLAGGVTDAEDWQSRMVQLLSETQWVILNPRRKLFPSETGAAEAQILWEFQHLQKAQACLFWFPPQTLCPIALFELGAWAQGKRPLFVGIDPAYQRRLDVCVQMSLVRPELKVVSSLPELARQATEYLDQITLKERA